MEVEICKPYKINQCKVWLKIDRNQICMSIIKLKGINIIRFFSANNNLKISINLKIYKITV